MEYCKYHPLKPATWYCAACDTHTCDDCSDESVYSDERRCFHCGAPMESLGAAYTVEPFWHHLKEIFRYPLNPPVMTLILVVSALGALLSFIPIIGVVAMLLAAGIFTKYSFRCLEETAEGNMVPPDIQDAYQGGLILIVKMILLLVAVVLGGAFLATFVGTGITSLLGMLVLFSVPAFLISYALTDSILSAVHPGNILRIISAVGMPYGILIGLIFLMGTSVDVLSYFVITDAEWITATLQSVISNYYMVVMFHMMGYVVFQYQEPLGFYARARTADIPQVRTQAEKLKAHVSVAVKEGQYDKVISLYREYLNRQADDVGISDSWFEFLYRSGNRELLADFAGSYLKLKLKKGCQDQLSLIYRQIQQLLPAYIPQEGEVCYQLALNCFNAGDYTGAVRLINGLQKKSRDIALLIRSFLLMAKALDELQKGEQAAKCRQLVTQLQRKADSVS